MWVLSRYYCISRCIVGGIYIKSFLPFDRKLILVSDQLFLYKSRPNFPSIFTAMHLLINSIDTERDTSVKMFHCIRIIYILKFIHISNFSIFLSFLLYKIQTFRKKEGIVKELCMASITWILKIVSLKSGYWINTIQ